VTLLNSRDVSIFVGSGLSLVWCLSFGVAFLMLLFLQFLIPAVLGNPLQLKYVGLI